MAKNESVASKRDSMVERLKKKYPEKEYADDESLFTQIYDDYDDYDKQIGEHEERQKSFSNMFTSDPRSARLMMEWKGGNDPAIALLRIYGDDIRAALDDPEKQKEIEEANKEFAEKVAQSDQAEKEFQKNAPESLKKLDEMVAKGEATDEQIDQAMESLVKIVREFFSGIYSRETIQLMLKAHSYDKDVEQAQMEGEVAGRNAQIEEKLKTKKKGDAVPHLEGKNNVGSNKRKKDLGALDRYGDSYESIWDK